MSIGGFLLPHAQPKVMWIPFGILCVSKGSWGIIVRDGRGRGRGSLMLSVLMDRALVFIRVFGIKRYFC